MFYASVFASSAWLNPLIGFTILDIMVVKPLSRSSFSVWLKIHGLVGSFAGYFLVLRSGCQYFKVLVYVGIFTLPSNNKVIQSGLKKFVSFFAKGAKSNPTLLSRLI